MSKMVIGMNAIKANKRIRLLPNRLWLFVLTVILTGLLLVGISLEEIPPALPLSFAVDYGDGSQNIEGWFNEDGICYVFLPGGTSMTEISLHKTTVLPVWLNGVQVDSGMQLSEISLGEVYRVKTPVTSNDVVFLQSANVSAVYIQTASGGMEHIHADKAYKEDVEVTVVDRSGDLNFSGKGSMKGRGNSSWNAVKKPYNLALDAPGDLLNMGTAGNWLLIAAYSDQTYLRNKLAFSLAESSGMEWTPECEFVDVYLNGVYNGLYLLTEKIEFGEYRLHENDPNAFLCKVEYESRWEKLSNPVRTDFGRVIEIVAPDQLENGEYAYIAEKIQQMENAILYGSEQEICQVLDLDSWVRRYLVDEISANNDADIASSYFYYRNGKIYAGPVWDYDIAFGNYYCIKNPSALYAIHYDSHRGGMPYYHALYQHAFFRERVSQIYEAEFLPVLDRMIETEILSQAEALEASAALDGIRWDPELGWLPSSVALIGPDPDPQHLVEYLRQRRDFLSTVWLDEVDYWFIGVELLKGGTLAWYAVPRGEKFDNYSQLSPLDENITVWYDSKTGELFDPESRITEDLVLLQEP